MPNILENIKFCEDTAGLITCYNNFRSKKSNWTLHLFVKPKFWVWGKEQDEDFDIWGIYSWGLGPFFLLCKF